jgi:ribosomal protein L40E
MPNRNPKGSGILPAVVMTKTGERICRACGAVNRTAANRCVECGAEFESESETEKKSFVDEDPVLRYVDPDNRVEVSRYAREDDVTLACGLLRANQIPCEVSSMVIPGLPTDLILWVNTQDAKKAWALLADVDREASSGDSDAA